MYTYTSHRTARYREGITLARRRDPRRWNSTRIRNPSEVAAKIGSPGSTMRRLYVSHLTRRLPYFPGDDK